MTGKSRGFFPSCGASVGFLMSYDGELREHFVWPQGKSSLNSSCEGERGIAL